MEWLESDYQTINQKNKFLFLNKIKSNQNPTILNCYIFNESNNPNQDLYFLTDLKLRLKVKLNPKKLNLIRPFYAAHKTTTPNQDVKFIKIYLKQFLYSTMINFRNSKEQFIFMMIDDFDLKSEQPTQAPKTDIQKLIRWDHLQAPGTTIQKLNPPIELNTQQATKSNLSLLVDDLSQARSGQNADYTIEIVKEKEVKKNTDLNEAFANETDYSTSNNTCSNRTLEPSFVNVLDPKVSSQINPIEPNIDCSIIGKSSIQITKIQDLTDDEDDEDDDDNENVSKTIPFSPKMCNTHLNFILETQLSNSSVKKRRKLLDDKCAEELTQVDSSLISSESESPMPSARVHRTYSTCSSASTSSSSLSLSSSCVTPKSGFFKPKIGVAKSEPRHIGQMKKAKNSHLVFSPIKSKPERQEKLKEIKKNFMSNSTRSMYKQLNSPAKLNSVLVDKILNLNKNVISSDEDDLDMNKSSKSLFNQMRRRKLLFDKSNQLKQLDKVFDSDKSIPSGQEPHNAHSTTEQAQVSSNSLINTTSANSIQIGLLNYKFVSSQMTDDKLQDYLVSLAQMTQKSNSTNSSNI